MFQPWVGISLYKISPIKLARLPIFGCWLIYHLLFISVKAAYPGPAVQQICPSVINLTENDNEVTRFCFTRCFF